MSEAYEELANTGPFLLPKNHEDPEVTLQYFLELEDYDKCIQIRDKCYPGGPIS